MDAQWVAVGGSGCRWMPGAASQRLRSAWRRAGRVFWSNSQPSGADGRRLSHQQLQKIAHSGRRRLAAQPARLPPALALQPSAAYGARLGTCRNEAAKLGNCSSRDGQKTICILRGFDGRRRPAEAHRIVPRNAAGSFTSGSPVSVKVSARASATLAKCPRQSYMPSTTASCAHRLLLCRPRSPNSTHGTLSCRRPKPKNRMLPLSGETHQSALRSRRPWTF